MRLTAQLHQLLKKIIYLTISAIQRHSLVWKLIFSTRPGVQRDHLLNSTTCSSKTADQRVRNKLPNISCWIGLTIQLDQLFIEISGSERSAVQRDQLLIKERKCLTTFDVQLHHLSKEINCPTKSVHLFSKVRFSSQWSALSSLYSFVCVCERACPHTCLHSCLYACARVYVSVSRSELPHKSPQYMHACQCAHHIVSSHD